MKKVITYGTYDLLHFGHVNLLRRAKELGDYLIVGVTSNTYDKERGKLNVKESLLQRIENIRATGFADEIIVEEFEGQKILDIQKYGVDIFAIGSDWEGKFNYLNEYCEVLYLERTRGVSSTELRQKGKSIISMGVIGCGRIAKRFILESKYVSGVNVEGVYNPRISSAKKFAGEQELAFYTDRLDEFFSKINAVYIASPHQTHYEYIVAALNAGKNVLCEKPIVLTEKEAKTAFALAKEKGLVLLEAIKTAYCPAFEHLLILAKSGRIGDIKDVEAAFSKLSSGNIRELRADMAGGSVNELGSYPFLPIIKLLGTDYEDVTFYSYIKNDIDLFTKGILKYQHATASFKVGLGAKTEGELIITGTKGYIYVPAPWWKTDYFEMRFEDLRDTNKYFYKFEGDGLRYEILEFISMINNGVIENHKLMHKESIAIAGIIEKYKKENVKKI